MTLIHSLDQSAIEEEVYLDTMNSGQIVISDNDFTYSIDNK